MIEGNGRGRPGWYELKDALHINVLVASLVTGVLTGLRGGFSEWWHSAEPALEVVLQQLCVAGATAAIGVASVYVKNIFSDNRGKVIRPKRKKPRAA